MIIYLFFILFRTSSTVTLLDPLNTLIDDIGCDLIGSTSLRTSSTVTLLDPLNTLFDDIECYLIGSTSLRTTSTVAFLNPLNTLMDDVGQDLVGFNLFLFQHHPTFLEETCVSV